MSFYSIFFSATGRTRKASDIVSSVFEGEKNFLDLSDPNWSAPAQPFRPEDVCLVSVSVFEGRVPEPAVERLRQLQGNGAQAILAAFFGNRAIDDCLRELEDILVDRGFRCRAALEASIEHSLFPQYGTGRPDEADRAELLEFARKIKAGLEADSLPQNVTVPGNRPYKQLGGISFKPKGGEACIKCGLCAQNCPAGAIPVDAPDTTDGSKCINCMRCTVICPTHARDYDPALMEMLGQKMEKYLSGRKPNALYLN